MPDNEMIYKALVEYEEAHYMSEDNKWQKQINRLIEEYDHKKNVEDENILPTEINVTKKLSPECLDTMFSEIDNYLADVWGYTHNGYSLEVKVSDISWDKEAK